MPVQNAAEILPTHTPVLFAEAVRRAAELLRAGHVVALPTETVYGLAANALDASAVAEIYEVKRRPAHNPIIVHVDGIAMARRCVAAWPEMADRFAAAFWPGPLTLVLPRSAQVPAIVAAGGPTVGVRWPSHPLMQAVIRECGFPLAAPSANLASSVSPTNSEHVRKQLGRRVSLIVDGGQSQVGIESTVLDLTVSPPRVLRPGMISSSSLSAVAGGSGNAKAESRLAGGAKAGGPLRSPGLLEKHYAPKARVLVLKWEGEADLRSQTAKLGLDSAAGRVIAHTRIPLGRGFGGVSVVPHDAEAFGRALYAELHRCDDEGAQWIAVESPPEGPEWEAISDRLLRASQ